MSKAYAPLVPARRPGGKPKNAPGYRILVERKYASSWREIADRVGLQQAQQFWDHVSQSAGEMSALASTCIPQGKAGLPKRTGLSRTYHYELSSKARIDNQFSDDYRTSGEADPHPVDCIWTMDYTSH